MVFLILESLGSTELGFILLMALVFFGPRKLPQLSRTLGKNLASFRKASEDFKRTWDKEVSMEEFSLSRIGLDLSLDDDSPLTPAQRTSQPAPPVVETLSADQIVARQATKVDESTTAKRLEAPEIPAEPQSKRDWL